MNVERLEALTAQLYSTTPLIGGLLRRRAAKALARESFREATQVLAEAVTRSDDERVRTIAIDALSKLSAQPDAACEVWASTRHDDLARLLVEPLAQACDDADDEIAERAGLALRNLNRTEEQEELCRLLMEHEYQLAREIAIEAQYAPRDGARRAMFYFLTEQWEKYESLDFDHAMLRTIYETADENLRRRIAERARIAGRVEWVDVVSGGRQARRVERMTEAEWATALSVLRDRGHFDEMWQLAQVAPPNRSKLFLRQLKTSGWKPKEEEAFNTLIKLSEKCSDESLGLDWSPLRSKALGGHTGAVDCLAVSPDGRVLASGSADGTVRLWSLPDGTLLKTLLGHKWGIQCLAISPNGKVLASGSLDSTVVLWSLPDGELLITLEGHTDWVRSLAISPDGRVLASGSNDKTVRLWSMPDGLLLNTLGGYADSVRSLTISPDGRVLASGNGDETVRLWSLPDGNLLRTLEGHEQYVSSLAISADGSILASGGHDNTVRLWSLPDGASLNTLKGHTDYVRSLAISADGCVLMSGSYDRTARLWSLPDGRLLKTLEGHTQYVSSLAINPDGSVLASGSIDHTVRLWNLLDGGSVEVLEGHTECVTCLAFSPMGGGMASGSSDKTVRLWHYRLLQLSRLPVNKTTLEDLAWAQETLRNGELSGENRSWSEFIVALMERHRQFDIEIGEGHIEVGEFDIEIEG